MLAVKLWEKIETDYLMSWLSTLGGAFSALGEQFSQCVSFSLWDWFYLLYVYHVYYFRLKWLVKFPKNN